MNEPFCREDAELLRDFLIRKTGSWSANAVVKMIQAMDLGMRRQDALAIVRGYLGHGNRVGRPPKPPELPGLGTSSQGPSGTSSASGLGTSSRSTSVVNFNGVAGALPEPVPSRAANILKQKTSIASELRSSGLLGHFVPSQSKDAGARKENNDEKPRQWAEWIAPLGTEFKALAKLQLRELKTEQRYVMGRTHAVLFGNYRVDEKANRAAGVRLAVQFARMGNLKRFQDITAREYVAYGVKLLQMRAGKPFHSPFDIEAVIDYVG